MKNVSKLKTESPAIMSPKTPSGISKSLLTPCRRLGLTKSRKSSLSRSSLSPAISICNNSKKASENNDKFEDTSIKDDSDTDEPALKVHVDKIDCVDISSQSRTGDGSITEKHISSSSLEDVSEVSVPSKQNKLKSEMNEFHSQNNPKSTNKILSRDEEQDLSKTVSQPVRKKSNQKTPKNKKKNKASTLTKKCVVVVQRNVFDAEIDKTPDTSKENTPTLSRTRASLSQNAIDSDSDDVGLSKLSKLKNSDNVSTVKVISKRPRTLDLDDEDDFHANSSQKSVAKITKLECSKQKSSVKICMKNSKPKQDTPSTQNVNQVSERKPISENGSDDDDFAFDPKKTILIRKSYIKEKGQPQKAKSTGSITQKDIDELKARIEMKRSLLLTKSAGKDVEELKELIRKWKKGCQDALTELLDLMRRKLPDKDNMTTIDLLRMLNIPVDLVGYDIDNEWFLTPE